MFTPEARGRLRDVLISVARADDRITAAALTGSAALGAEDRWSDIDLALSVAAAADLSPAIADWTSLMYAEHGAVHHLDVSRGATVYRVFLLASTLQVDIAFSPEAEFGASAPTFRLLFGTAPHQEPATGPAAAELAGLGWLYAPHARWHVSPGARDVLLRLPPPRRGPAWGQDEAATAEP
jgi:predicted nucleotidyltransferase